jgi:hypothetical protein
VHRDLIDRDCLTGTERKLSSKAFVAGLHRRGLTREQAADVVCQLFGVSRGAARLYVRSHPAFAAEEVEPCGSRRS